MAVTNLTGTKWLLNATITTMPNGELIDADIGNGDDFNLIFLSNSNSYSLIHLQDADYGSSSEWGIYYNTTHVFGPGAWTNEAYRTIEITGGTDVTDARLIAWLESNATLIPSGYSITFEENGGSTVTDLTLQTALPSPLPTTTKANHVFAGWYYDNLFTQKATAGDELTTNVTLYAKWYTPTTWCEDIANAIREKDGSSEPIKHVDFGERVNALPSPKEEETKTVTPNFSSGNVVVTPTSGKVMTQVTVNKDTTNHKAENIKKDITLYGVTGTLESGGGGYTVTFGKSGTFNSYSYIQGGIHYSFDNGVTYHPITDGKSVITDSWELIPAKLMGVTQIRFKIVAKNVASLVARVGSVLTPDIKSGNWSAESSNITLSSDVTYGLEWWED